MLDDSAILGVKINDYWSNSFGHRLITSTKYFNSLIGTIFICELGRTIYPSEGAVSLILIPSVATGKTTVYVEPLVPGDRMVNHIGKVMMSPTQLQEFISNSLRIYQGSDYYNEFFDVIWSETTAVVSIKNTNLSFTLSEVLNPVHPLARRAELMKKKDKLLKEIADIDKQLCGKS